MVQVVQTLNLGGGKMKKMLSIVGAMLIAGAVMAGEYVTVKIINESFVDLEAIASFRLVDLENSYSELNYVTSGGGIKIVAQEQGKISLLKPMVKQGINLDRGQIIICIKYGKSTLSKSQYKTFKVQKDKELPNTLTIASENPEEVEFTILSNPDSRLGYK
jgi:hypothetical protein